MTQNGEVGSASVARWDEALGWYATLRDAEKRDLTEAIGREWQHWYTDAENRRVFDDISRLLADRGRYRQRRRRRRAELEQDGYDLSIPIAEWRNGQALLESARERSPAMNWWWLFGGIGVAAIAVLFVLSSLRFWTGGSASNPAVYQTDVGRLKDLHLRDGSSVVLGGRTKLSIAFSAQRRTVRLIQGQAWFKVAHNPRWPFTVAAGDGTITAVGTAFLVTRDSDRVVVTVTEGTVDVSARPPELSQGSVPSPALVPIRISRGEELTYSDEGILSPVKATDAHGASAWTHGRLTFDNQPLRYVVEAVDRYSPRHIVISPAAGALRFSGIVSDDKIEAWLQSLEVIFPVTVEEQGPHVLIQLRYFPSANHESTRKPSRDSRP